MAKLNFYELLLNYYYLIPSFICFVPGVAIGVDVANSDSCLHNVEFIAEGPRDLLPLARIVSSLMQVSASTVS